jgi:hypothetical protein
MGLLDIHAMPKVDDMLEGKVPIASCVIIVLSGATQHCQN